MKRFALVGNPNSGKTTLFNSLTGSTAHVGNWPGVTVDKKEGSCKLGKEIVSIIDLPGIYSLSPYTPEEVITRNFIIDEEPDCVINIIDSTNLERNLYLTTQLMEMDVPIVIALNMTDVLEKNGDIIDEKELSKQIGLPVIRISALKQNNLKKLVDIAIKESEKSREGISVLENSFLGHLIKDLTISFHTIGVQSPLFHATKLAEQDELEVKNHPELLHVVEHFKKENLTEKQNDDYEAFIADYRYKHITKYYSPCLIKNRKDEEHITKSDKIDKVLTHKIWGIPIFISILFLMFHLTFSENFLFLGGLFKNGETNFSFIPDDSIFVGFKGLFYTTNGINSLGVILSNLINALTGALLESIRQGLSFAPSWVNGLVCDGILNGIFAILGFLPQILLLFLLFSILEDSGYMSRIAFLLDRILRKFGLSGRAFLPLIMGFGCSVPAMINTRTIANEKERIATIRIIPFFSCGAKLPTLTAIGGVIAISFGFANVDIITLLMYCLGMSVGLISVIIMRKTTLKGKDSPFVMELPSYHLPQLKSTLLLVWDKGKHFIKKAFTVILASTIVIWFISHFGPGNNGLWEYVGDDMSRSILSMLGKIIQPIFIPVGFGLSTYGWVFVVAIITGLIAKENTIATLSTLTASILTSLGITLSAGDNAIEVFINQMINESSPLYNSFFAEHGTSILLSFIAFNMLTIPCIATIATAKGELGYKRFYSTVIFWIAVSFIISSFIFLVTSFWWTISIFVSIAVLAFLLVRILLKRKEKQYGTTN